MSPGIKWALALMLSVEVPIATALARGPGFEDMGALELPETVVRDAPDLRLVPPPEPFIPPPGGVCVLG